MKIDQDVAAEDQVEIRELEGRGSIEKAQEIMLLETDQGAEFRPDLPLVLSRIHEIAIPLRGRHGAKRPFPEPRLPGHVQEAVVDVRTDDADAPCAKALTEE